MIIPPIPILTCLLAYLSSEPSVKMFTVLQSWIVSFISLSFSLILCCNLSPVSSSVSVVSFVVSLMMICDILATSGNVLLQLWICLMEFGDTWTRGRFPNMGLYCFELFFVFLTGMAIASLVLISLMHVFGFPCVSISHPRHFSMGESPDICI